MKARNRRYPRLSGKDGDKSGNRERFYFSVASQISPRVWKGIFGIRDLTKILCGNRENDKYIDGIWDLTVPREAGLAKSWAQDAGFMFAYPSGMPETVTTHRFKLVAKANQPGER